MSVEVLKDIRQEPKELRLLYKQLVEKLIPTKEPTPEERKATQSTKYQARLSDKHIFRPPTRLQPSHLIC